ncbi:hypothetical protein [Sporomusa acidovorans]|uniref:hypothetical protein n=1 Tax=Sporomusa acidovorans TaxID=112900 RepID=UPI00146DBC65|nr:hypothetical protein [Sporomusa acidovorans]
MGWLGYAAREDQAENSRKIKNREWKTATPPSSTSSRALTAVWYCGSIRIARLI